ncbi:peptidase inhibitor family I36 protein [Saccharopolyspora dendranthemae]|uniref:Peptidase inhibitor family I36 n=1 Tax=Saccharopolyspora dendranthemae TaxID=1181886 RepID=A0A561U9R7_9PSEU|nr:peptidase inhibitor family I36 protein [Saccharopolyspora dendranthemae]TWF96103.1 peptidase inhibitor family I36 [Saccharopolyspora dendranthemae]
MNATPIRKAAAVGAGCFLIMGAGAGLASGETPEEANQRALAECGEGNLCVWDDPGYQGRMVSYYECIEVDPFDEFVDGQAGSFLNHQTPGTVAVFFGPDPNNPEGPWVERYHSAAPEEMGDATPLDARGVDPC